MAISNINFCKYLLSDNHCDKRWLVFCNIKLYLKLFLNISCAISIDFSLSLFLSALFQQLEFCTFIIQKRYFIHIKIYEIFIWISMTHLCMNYLYIFQKISIQSSKKVICVPVFTSLNTGSFLFILVSFLASVCRLWMMVKRQKIW